MAEPLVSYRAMFDAEVYQAKAEIRRPWAALLVSGVVAGATVGTAVLLLAIMVAETGGLPENVPGRLLFGSIYALGFVLAILARTDLFTEYTTIAILPVLTGDARIGPLLRLWALVYLGNMLGGIAIGALLVVLGPALELFEGADLALLARHLAAPAWWVVMLSGTLAGWLMGLLSWLIAGGRDTTSQILFIWLIGMAIGASGLHHAVTGGIEMFAAALADPSVTWRDVGHVVLWATLGNALGGIVFAGLIRLGVQMHPRQEPGETDREEGRRAARSGG